MRAGKLRHKIVIQQPITTRNTYGEDITSWEPFVETRASVEPLRGREFWAAQQVQAETVYKITMRYRDGVRTDMRVMHDGKVLAIQSVINVADRKIQLELMCREGVENG